jgi:pectin methylesterase-like acyl-CoA thioesterase
VCVETPLSIQFDQPARVGKTGRIGVYNSRGVLVDTVDSAASPQTRLIGGVSYVYFPVIVTGATAVIYPHQPLPYRDSYYVTMEPGAITDASGAPFVGFSDANRWSFSAQAAGPTAGAAALTVAANGTGDFCTVQSAIDYVPAANTQPITITMRAGTYTEINYVPSNKPFIAIRGEDRDGVVIQYANNANVNSGNPRAMFGVDAPDFTLENITLYNTTPRGGSQAEAFRGNNQRMLNRVNLKSFQDTLLLQGAAMVANSYIEGDVDFTWGIGAVYFQNCELKSVTSGGLLSDDPQHAAATCTSTAA